MYFNNFPDTSRVWIYTSDKPFEGRSESIEAELTKFVEQWAAHGNQLYGAGAVLHDRFIVLCVDESQVASSGCSVDTSVRFIKALQEKYGLNFFDRMQMVVEKNDDRRSVHISELSNYKDWSVYNPIITTLGELKKDWLIPVATSPFV